MRFTRYHQKVVTHDAEELGVGFREKTCTLSVQGTCERRWKCMRVTIRTFLNVMSQV